MGRFLWTRGARQVTITHKLTPELTSELANSLMNSQTHKNSILNSRKNYLTHKLAFVLIYSLTDSLTFLPIPHFSLVLQGLSEVLALPIDWRSMVEHRLLCLKKSGEEVDYVAFLNKYQLQLGK